MGRGIPKASKQIKEVIDKLKQGPIYHSDLEKTRFFKTKEDLGRTIPRTSLHRILNDYLKYWGLVKREEDEKGVKWIWHQLPHYETWTEYKVALNHSQHLIYGLESICVLLVLIGTKRKYIHPQRMEEYQKKYQKGSENFVFAFEHLASGYPDIFKDLIHYDQVCGCDLMSRLTEEYQKRKEELIQANIPNSMFEKIIHNTKTLFSSPSISDEQHRQILWELREKHKKALDTSIEEENLFQQLTGSIYLLIRRIEQGQPIEGKCSSCPNLCIGHKQ